MLHPIPILRGMKGIRYLFRNFTALAVKEHLRSQIEETGARAELTPNEVELVRFAIDRSDQLEELAERSAREDVPTHSVPG